MQREHLHGSLLAFTGVMALSFDGLLVRLANTQGMDIVFWRGLLMALALTLLLRILDGRWAWTHLRLGGRDAGWVAAGFAATTILFVLAILHTTVANVVVILAASPLFAAVFSGLLLHEWVPLRTWIAMLIAIGGIGGVLAGSLEAGGWLGDALALLAALVVGINLTLLRRSPRVDRLAVIAAGGMLAALIAWPLATPLADRARQPRGPGDHGPPPTPPGADPDRPVDPLSAGRRGGPVPGAGGGVRHALGLAVPGRGPRHPHATGRRLGPAHPGRACNLGHAPKKLTLIF